MLLVAALAAILVGPSAAYAIVVTDDFTDGNDTANPAWVHMDGTINNTGRMWDASTGQYFMHANNDSSNPGVVGYGLVGSYVNTPFSDVRVSADIVDFTPPLLENPTPAYFGVAARLHGVQDLNSDTDFLDPEEVNAQPTAENGLSLRGYMYVYEPFQGFPSPTGGEMVLYIFDGGGDTDVRSQKVRLDNTKDYRFVLEVVGPTLHGQVFNLTDGGVMVAEAFRDLVVEPRNTDHDGNPGTAEIPHDPFLTSGYSGVFAVGSSIASADMQLTVDNFRTETLVAGDYNRNGVVDAADYVIWRKTLGETGPNGNPPTSFGNLRANGAFSPGDTQTIDDADYEFWRSNFGKSETVSGSGSLVPEPAGATLVVVVLLALGFARRHSCCCLQ